MLDAPLNYELALSNGWYRLSSRGRKCKFSAPATVRGIAKLYTISSDGSLLYAGIASQPMASRLNYGFKANGVNGYHGYKWKFLETNLKLSVWTATLNGVYAPLHDMEIVEAEVVLTCRQKSGQWPSHQHEIHFSPSEERHRRAAEAIYKHATDFSVP